MKHDLPSTPRLALTAAVVLALGAGVTTAAAIIGASDGEPGGRTTGPSGISLVAYDSCDTALTELKERVLPHVGPYGLGPGGFPMPPGVMTEEGDAAGGAERMAVPDAAPGSDMSASAPKEQQGQGHSGTNVQEAGVDEPDIVKTDGKRVISITDGVLRVVDVESRAQTAAVPLAAEGGGYPTEMLLAGDRALVLTSPEMAYSMPDIAAGEPSPKPVPTDTFPYSSRLVLVDLTGAGKILGSLSVDGNYLDARQVDGVARVVIQSAPRLQFRYPQTTDSNVPTMFENKDVVNNSTIQDWLPRYELTAGGATTSGQLTACADVSHPADYSATGMLTVLTFDLQRELGTGEPVTIVADGQTVYGTSKNLYIANNHYGLSQGTPATPRTELYLFDVSGSGKPVHVASGAVDGSLLNQYSLSEFDGNLRVATTTSPVDPTMPTDTPTTNAPTQSPTQSGITVLARKDNTLVQVGSVDGLGVGERIYAVRFLGDTAYVVTFRETDPLYTVDLSDPAAPKVTGELKIPGYSAYLHPAGDGRLIGVGQDANENGGVLGTQVSLFDTSNPAGATRIAQYFMANGWSEVEADPHAFLYWPEKGLVVLPMSGTAAGQGGALVLKLDGDEFVESGTLTHMSEKYGNIPTVPRRAFVIGAELWTVSEAGMLVNDLDSLSQLAWLPFT
jgi:hypothetical protein